MTTHERNVVATRCDRLAAQIESRRAVLAGVDRREADVQSITEAIERAEQLLAMLRQLR